MRRPSRRALPSVAALVALLVVTGCSRPGGIDKKGAVGAGPAAPGRVGSGTSGGPATVMGTPAQTLAPLPRPVTSDRDLIRTGALTVRVGDVAKAARQAADIAAGAGGSVYDERTEQQHEPGTPATSTLSLRVAPERFDEAMDAFDGVGQRLERTVSVQDVTEQVADVSPTDPGSPLRGRPGGSSLKRCGSASARSPARCRQLMG